jgi:hypothetical protein
MEMICVNKSRDNKQNPSIFLRCYPSPAYRCAISTGQKQLELGILIVLRPGLQLGLAAVISIESTGVKEATFM